MRETSQGIKETFKDLLKEEISTDRGIMDPTTKKAPKRSENRMQVKQKKQYALIAAYVPLQRKILPKPTKFDTPMTNSYMAFVKRTCFPKQINKKITCLEKYLQTIEDEDVDPIEFAMTAIEVRNAHIQRRKRSFKRIQFPAMLATVYEIKKLYRAQPVDRMKKTRADDAKPNDADMHRRLSSKMIIVDPKSQLYTSFPGQALFYINQAPTKAV